MCYMAQHDPAALALQVPEHEIEALLATPLPTTPGLHPSLRPEMQQAPSHVHTTAFPGTAMPVLLTDVRPDPHNGAHYPQKPFAWHKTGLVQHVKLYPVFPIPGGRPDWFPGWSVLHLGFIHPAFSIQALGGQTGPDHMRAYAHLLVRTRRAVSLMTPPPGGLAASLLIEWTQWERTLHMQWLTRILPHLDVSSFQPDKTRCWPWRRGAPQDRGRPVVNIGHASNVSVTRYLWSFEKPEVWLPSDKRLFHRDDHSADAERCVNPNHYDFVPDGRLDYVRDTRTQPFKRGQWSRRTSWNTADVSQLRDGQIICTNCNEPMGGRAQERFESGTVKGRDHCPSCWRKMTGARSRVRRDSFDDLQRNITYQDRIDEAAMFESVRKAQDERVMSNPPALGEPAPVRYADNVDKDIAAYRRLKAAHPELFEDDD